MKKKILIIESERIALCAMFRLVRDAGHEVLGIIVENSHSPNVGIVCTDDPVQIIESARYFRPDIVFLEHDLGLGPHLTGRYFASHFEPRPGILVGTSIYDQSYCPEVMREKMHLEHPLSVNKFIALLSTLTAKVKAIEPVS